MMLRVHEVAARLGVHVRTVQRWMRDGHLPYAWIGGERRVKESVVEEWLKEAA